MAKHEFDKDNQPKDEARKPRGKGKKSLMLDAIRETCTNGDEMEYLKKVVAASLGDPTTNPPTPPNPTLMTLVINRVEPPLKGVSPMVSFDFDPDAIPAVQASQAMAAAASGLIPTDIASLFVTSIASMLKIEEVTEIARRLSEIEKVLEANG